MFIMYLCVNVSMYLMFLKIQFNGRAPTHLFLKGFLYVLLLKCKISAI